MDQRMDAAMNAPHMDDAAPPDDSAEADVAKSLGSWHSAADRLEAAHRSKCVEVRRLRGELAARDAELAAQNAELAQRHRLGDFAATVARLASEMQDRLQGVRDHLDLLERRLLNDPSGQELAEKVVTDLAAWETGLHDLIAFGCERQPEADLLSVRDLVEGARSALTHQLTQGAVHVVVDVPEDARTRGDQQLLQRAIVNVVLEALDRVPHGGEVLVAAAESDEATEVEIACASGALSMDARPGVARPNPDPAAVVLRWAVVHHILQQHGGEAIAKGDDDSRTSYVLRIPHQPCA